MIYGQYAVDYQVHSFRSHDGRASIADHCKRAVEIGLDEIGFSEHKDFDPADPVVEYFDYDAYMAEISEARSRWAGLLVIRAGVEIDYQLWFEDVIASYLSSHPFDFVLGSVHYVNRVKVMSAEYNRERDARKAYGDYFHAVKDSVRSGLFDVLAHLEYANRLGLAAWGPYHMLPYEEELTEILGQMTCGRMILEVNTAGLHQGLGVTYPCRETVELYARLGGDSVSIGSDAHHPDQLGFQYLTAVNIARSAGIANITTWSNREPALLPLNSP